MKTIAIWAVLIAAALLVTWLIRGRVSMPILDLTPPTGAPQGPSVFAAIQEQISAGADKPLDYDKLPQVAQTSPDGITFAPGAIDAIMGTGGAKNDEWKAVREVVRAVNAGQISDWRVVEKNVRKITTSSCVDTVLANLGDGEFSPAVKRIFWQMARESRDYEAVKWGIVIGSVKLRVDEVADLLVLARHAEFSLYTSHALFRESQFNSELKNHLVALLPMSYQWGVVKLVEYIVRDRSLIQKKTVQRDVLIYGMKNCQSITMEIGFTIAKSVDVPFFCQAGAGDDRVYRAVVSLMDTLINEPQPLGGLVELDNWTTYYDAYVDMLVKRPVDTRLLAAFSSLEHFLADEKLDWNRRKIELVKIRQLASERFSLSVLKAGLGAELDRWAALQMISEKKVTELLPDVEALFNKNPDYMTILILDKLGGRRELEVMMAKVPSLVDLDSRKELPMSRINVFGPESRHDFEYAQIIEAMGRLATPTAIVHIKTALADFNPQVRSAACKAVAQLPIPAIDNEIKELVTQRFSDQPAYVTLAARTAAHHIGIPVPPALEKASDPFQNLRAQKH